MLFLNNICRTCNTEDPTLVNIFAHNENQTLPDLTHMLEYCTQTTLMDNAKYPQGVCYNCIKQLEICYRFLKRFRLAQNEFDEAHGYLEETVQEMNCSLETENEIVSCRESEHIQMNLNVPQNKIQKLLVKVKCEEVVEMPTESINIDLATEIHTSDISVTCLRSKLETSKQTVICHICCKQFFTAKALNLHLKINHKQKLV